MWRNYLQIFTIALAVLLSTSCEVPVEIEGDSKIVVQSYFSNNKDLIVYVTESSHRTTSSMPIFVENATVTLYSGDSNNDFLSALTLIRKNGQSYYQTLNFQPQVEKIYVLNVEVPGYQPVTASNSIPKPVDLNEIEIANPVTANEGGEQSIDFDFTVTIDDPIGTENFYHILCYQELISAHTATDGTIRFDTIKLDSNEEIFIEAKTKTIGIKQLENEPSFLLTDEHFNGLTTKINFLVHYVYDPEQYERGDFQIEMRTVSKEYYQHYLNTFPKLGSLGNNGPFDVNGFYDNINNGAGIFAGYSSSYRTLRF